MEKTEKKEAGQPNPENQVDDTTFFNVMPKTRNSSLIMPTIKIVPKEAPAKSQPGAFTEPPKTGEVKPGFWRQHRFYFFLAIFVAGLSIAAYFVVPKFFVEDYGQTNFLVQPLGQKSLDTAPEEKNFWLVKYFGRTDCEETMCGNQADPDRDGYINLKEYEGKTDPNNPDSDKDGISDGDEVNIFDTDPTKDHSGVNSQYSDTDYIKNGYNPKTDQKFTVEEFSQIAQKLTEFDLHQPTITNFENQLTTIYKFNSGANKTPETVTPPVATSTPVEIDQSPEAKQDRDIMRSLTIKNIGIALIKYNADFKTFPEANEFKEMFSAVKPYLKTATNPSDPVNSGQMVYTYSSNVELKDFTLTYFSETLNQTIKKTAKDAAADKANAEAAAFDDQRRSDIDSLRSALLVYSADNIGGNQEYTFPAKDKYKTALVPRYMSSVPKDPKTGAEYDYQVSSTFDTFTLKAGYELPASGKTGYMCNQEECSDY